MKTKKKINGIMTITQRPHVGRIVTATTIETTPFIADAERVCNETNRYHPRLCRMRRLRTPPRTINADDGTPGNVPSAGATASTSTWATVTSGDKDVGMTMIDATHGRYCDGESNRKSWCAGRN